MVREKRVFERARLDSISFLHYQNQCFPVLLEDISLQGAAISCNNPVTLQRGVKCLLEIKPQDSDIVLNLEALTVHHCVDKIGLMFCENEPEAVQNLYYIVESNVVH